MSESLKPGEPVNKGVKRVTRARLDKTLRLLAPRKPTDAAVHDARKQLKSIRGVLRLVSKEMGGRAFARANRTYRDAARPLSVVRDGSVLVDSLNALVEAYPGGFDSGDVAGLQSFLSARSQVSREAAFGRHGVARKSRRRLRQARKRIRKWPLRRTGWSAIKVGLSATYRRGRRAIREVRREATDDALHEWRKRTKDIRYQLEFLRNMSPDTFKHLARETHRLADLLGNDRDLALLRQVLEQERDQPARNKNVFVALIGERRAELQRQAVQVGDQLFADPPRVYARRLKDYWRKGKRAENRARRQAGRGGS